MQLTSFTDYALRVLVYAAVQGDRRCQTAEVASMFGISRHHVVKVVNELAHLGYLDTVRGRDGGFTLAQRPDQVCLGDVVRRTEGSIAIVECFDPKTNSCPLLPACGLKDALGEAFAEFLAVLDRRTLADLMAEPRWIARMKALPARPLRRRRAAPRPAASPAGA